MAFYASQYVGTGADVDPFRPAAAQGAMDVGSRWAAIDLRADPTQQAGWSFVWTEAVLSPLPSGVVLVAAAPDDELSQPTLNAIKSALGVNVAKGATFRQAVRAILTSEARLDGARWAPLVADASGQLRIFLGEYVDVWQP